MAMGIVIIVVTVVSMFALAIVVAFNIWSAGRAEKMRKAQTPRNGYEAHLKGFHLRDNPYRIDTKEYMEWWEGWVRSAGKNPDYENTGV
jgi:hypothetical protein